MKENLSRMWRSGIAMLLALCLVIGMCPAVAFAAENADEAEYEECIQTALDKLNSLMAEVSEEDKAALKAKIEELKEVLKALIAELEVVLAEQQAKLEALKQELAEKIAQLENAVAEQKAKLEAEIAELKATIAKIEATIEKLVNAINELYQTVMELTNAVKALVEEGIATVKEIVATVKAVVTSVKNTVAAIEAFVKALPEMVCAKLNEAVEAVKALVNDVYFNTFNAEYVIAEDSYYVALGDSTAAGKSYAGLLAEELDQIFEGDYGFANLSKDGLMIQDLAAVLAENAEEIAKADLVTVGFGSNSFTNFVVEQLVKMTRNETVEFDWAQLVGENGVAYVEEAKAELYSVLIENGVEGEVMGVNLTDLLAMAVEAYAYSFIAYAINLPEVVAAVHELSPEALVVVVGMYNPLVNVALTMNDEKLEIGEYLQYLVDAANVDALANAMLLDDVIYVDAPEVEVSNTKTEMTALQFITEFVGNKAANLLPNENGHVYIAEQILNALIVSLEKEEEEEQGLWGDVNGDGKVNHNDARLVLQYNVGMVVADSLDLTVADVNGDGKVNHNDARLILQFYMGIITSFPAAV